MPAEALFDVFLYSVTSDALLDIWNSFYGFIAISLLGLGALGLFSKTLAIPAWAIYIGFAYIATSVEDQFLDEIMIVTLVLVSMGVAFKLWRSEAPTGG